MLVYLESTLGLIEIVLILLTGYQVIFHVNNSVIGVIRIIIIVVVVIVKSTRLAPLMVVINVRRIHHRLEVVAGRVGTAWWPKVTVHFKLGTKITFQFFTILQF